MEYVYHTGLNFATIEALSRFFFRSVGEATLWNGVHHASEKAALYSESTDYQMYDHVSMKVVGFGSLCLKFG